MTHSAFAILFDSKRQDCPYPLGRYQKVYHRVLVGSRPGVNHVVSPKLLDLTTEEITRLHVCLMHDLVFQAIVSK